MPSCLASANVESMSDAESTTCWTLVHRAVDGPERDREVLGRCYQPIVRKYLRRRWHDSLAPHWPRTEGGLASDGCRTRGSWRLWRRTMSGPVFPDHEFDFGALTRLELEAPAAGVPALFPSSPDA